jgi:SH3-like domain-containing protein
VLTLLCASPALAQTPVVQPQPNTHAQKPKAKPKPVAKPGAKTATRPAVPPAAPLPAPAPEPEVLPAPPVQAPDPSKGSVTGLAIPRFMSLRFDDVNLRVGPGTRYPIDWVYHRRDLPVEIIRELEDWRLVQDQDNVRGWVRAQTLSPRRGFVVRGATQALRAKPADDAAAVAMLKPGVVGHLRVCAAGQSWCEAEIGAYRGWLKRDDVFGLYPDEAFGG